MTKKNSRNKKNTSQKIAKIAIKIFLIITVFSVLLIQLNQEEFSNTLGLLAVNENAENEIIGGSIIDLQLKITPGNGDIFVNANPLKEIDTQLSITNGHDIACELFELDCSNYNFYYNFIGTSSILKGPSATASIAILTGKTLNQEKIPQDITMTGSLNSAGVIGTVGGIEEKITLAKNQGYNKVLIPQLAAVQSNQTNIEIVKVLDIVEAYNQFEGEQLTLTQETIDKTSYNSLMGSLANQMCENSLKLQQQLQTTNYSENTTKYQLYSQVEDRINSSQLALQREKYYSAASFCFGANNNLQTLIELQKNTTIEQDLKEIKKFSQIIEQKQQQLNNQSYIQTTIRTQNDFYVYLILQDRINEAQEFLKPYLNITNTTNISQENLKTSYAFAKQRYETIGLWSKFITHQGQRVYLGDELIENACLTITQEITTKQQVLEQYEITVFNELIEQQQNLSQKNLYQCIYNGLELQGRIDTIFFSYNIQENSSMNTTQKLFKLTQNRIARDEGENFPLIPFIYYEYAEELYTQEDYASSLLYINFALNFANIDFYIQEPENQVKMIIENAKDEFITHPLLILGALLIIGFL